MSDARRLHLSLLASLFVNAAALVALSLFWHWNPVPAATVLTRIKLVRVALRPTPPPVKLLPLPVVPAAKPTPKPHPVKPKRLPKHRKPGTKVKTSAPAPPAQVAGGSNAGASAPPAPAAPPIHVLAQSKPAVLIIHNAPLPLPPTPAFTPGVIAARPVPEPALTAQIGHGAAETGTAGRGPGAGEGSGTGSGTGSGSSLDAGEPFGVGKGLAGDGGPRHVVYVLDISGSMVSRIKRADLEIRKALNGLRSDETFDIIAFNNEIYSFDTELAPATPNMREKASAFLNTLIVNDGTNLEGAITAALSMPDVNEIVLLTDGVPTVGEQDFDRLAKLIRRRNKNRVRISAVGMVGRDPDGTDNSFEATTLLQQIARDSGGSCLIVPLGYK